MSNTVYCATLCVDTALAAAEVRCGIDRVCFCTDTIYVAAYRNCVSQNCDAANGQIWIQYAESLCAAVGVPFGTTAPTQNPNPTTVTAIAPTQNPNPTTVTAFVSSAYTVYPGTFTASVTGLVFGPTASISSQPSNSLSSGAIAGIVIGAVAFVLFVVGAAFLLWRRKRKTTQPVPPEYEMFPEGYQTFPTNDGAGWDKEVKQVARVTSAPALPLELSAEQASYATGYEEPADVTSHSTFSSSRIPATSHLNTGFSPKSANTEISAVVPSEFEAASPRNSDYGPPYQNTVKSDLANLSHGDTHYVAESGSPVQDGFSSIDGTRRPESVARELPVSPDSPQAPVFSSLHPSLASPHAVAGGSGSMNGADSGNTENEELSRMKAEIEAVRAEQEHLKRLQALGERERELSRAIVSMELSREAK